MSYSVSVAWRRTDHVGFKSESFAQVLSEQRYVVKRGGSVDELQTDNDAILYQDEYLLAVNKPARLLFTQVA